MYIVKIDNIEKRIPEEILDQFTLISELVEYYEKQNPNSLIVIFPK